ncbi:MAG TPA: MFS transporter [Propionibacteriaceae bacterium]|nr:MFS transporter [Propionibacteriaceae bacterium]
MSTKVAAAPCTLARRLRPLQIGVALQGLILWVPIEKLFMTQIGFDAASVGVMAAAYAAVVPLLEVPSGILADRWSRVWIMILGCVALMISSLIGGLSHSVIAYVVAAMVLGIYFAFSSGTVDSVVYDTVLEETGSNELYETWIGRIRAVESAGFVLSSLAGGVLAQYTSTRFTYFATIPLVGLAILAFLRFHEPRLHQAAERVSLRSHVALTFRTMITSRTVVRALLLVATAGLLAQAVFEFGPLWLVALGAPAVLYGPYWAVLVSTLGIGGLLAGKLHLERRLMLALLIVLSLTTALLLTWTRSLAVVVTTQVVLALVLAIVGIHASRLLHDAVPSSIRAGVSSGAGTITWALFVPFSLVFGWAALENGVDWSGFMLAGAVVVMAVLLVVSVRASRGAAPVEVPATAKEAAVEVAQREHEIACKQLVELVADYLDDALSPEMRARFNEHLAGCDGCTTYLSQTRRVMAELQHLSAVPDQQVANPEDHPHKTERA